MLDIVQSFPLLSYCIVSHIYISPICNVDRRIIFLWKIIILGILYFSLFTWYQSQRENQILFSSDRVSFRSPSPPPDLLLAAAGHHRHCRRRLSGKLFSGRKPQILKRTRPIYTPVATPLETGITRAVTRVSSPEACRPRSGA